MPESIVIGSCCCGGGGGGNCCCGLVGDEQLVATLEFLDDGGFGDPCGAGTTPADGEEITLINTGLGTCAWCSQVCFIGSPFNEWLDLRFFCEQGDEAAAALEIHGTFSPGSPCQVGSAKLGITITLVSDSCDPLVFVFEMQDAISWCDCTGRFRITLTEAP